MGEARNLFLKWLDRNGFDENVISKFDRAALIATHDDRDDIDAWRDNLPDADRKWWNDLRRLLEAWRASRGITKISRKPADKPTTAEMNVEFAERVAPLECEGDFPSIASIQPLTSSASYLNYPSQRRGRSSSFGSPISTCRRRPSRLSAKRRGNRRGDAVMTEHPDMSLVTEACTRVRGRRDQTSPRRAAGELGGLSKTG